MPDSTVEADAMVDAAYRTLDPFAPIEPRTILRWALTSDAPTSPQGAKE